MPKLKRFSGDELISVFRGFGFDVKSQRGSHIKLVRISQDGEKQIILIPNHKQISIGTCKEIYRKARRYVPEAELRNISTPTEGETPVPFSNMAAKLFRGECPLPDGRGSDEDVVGARGDGRLESLPHISEI